MKLLIFMLCFLFIGMGSIDGMKTMQRPKQLRHLDWKAHIREVDAERNALSHIDYEGTLDQILEYAVDRYEETKGKKLSEEDREKKKKELLNRVRRGQ